MVVVRGLFVGRFQPPHRGHIEALRELSGRFDELLIAIGSAQVSHTLQDPFTAGERFEMLDAAFAEAGVSGVKVVPLMNMDRNAVWVSHVISMLPSFGVVVSNNPLTSRLFRERGITVEGFPLIERGRYRSTVVRELMVAGDDSWREMVPPSVVNIIEEIDGVARITDLGFRDH